MFINWMLVVTNNCVITQLCYLITHGLLISLFSQNCGVALGSSNHSVLNARELGGERCLGKLNFPLVLFLLNFTFTFVLFSTNFSLILSSAFVEKFNHPGVNEPM